MVCELIDSNPSLGKETTQTSTFFPVEAHMLKIVAVFLIQMGRRGSDGTHRSGDEQTICAEIRLKRYIIMIHKVLFAHNNKPYDHCQTIKCNASILEIGS